MKAELHPYIDFLSLLFGQYCYSIFFFFKEMVNSGLLVVLFVLCFNVFCEIRLIFAVRLGFMQDPRNPPVDRLVLLAFPH